MKMVSRRFSSALAFRLCVALLLWLGLTLPAQAERIRDLASFAGVRENSLVGYGLVVGLDGTGDQTTQAPFTTQSLTNMLSQLGITVPQGTNMQLKNVAAVMITAVLPPFARPGQEIDVVVSSVGNARSLRGGTLLMAPLKGADGQIYALAQGNVLVGGVGAQAGGSSVQVNQQAVGRISGGATVEMSVPLELGANGTLDLQLDEYDFDTVQRAVTAINSEFGMPVAAALDGRVIRLEAPMDSNERVRFMARVQNIDLALGEGPARVIVNSRTGSVVLTSAVTLRRAAVAHGNLSITIDSNPQVSQPNPFAEGETVVVPNADITVAQEGGALQMLETSADLAQVVRALNALGATPQDLMSILQALKEAGSLRAELEIM
ncbi:flagellar basal body P-ring protein FlgI [Halomonas sp. McH1-25]|uniref:flagellar basal body P-ring protein FlgI n=1 Tax=unclassified Halomonas TaxID=2609666 RepID=UPI001EF581D1|nr:MULTISPECIES: flagellar basal body P-ring protein FlgI [unclassified Halomonas]MCG7598659.1 flagellar basal body P-ring protein FlgI [Halomonas sp. McH1-25]MCP1343642.1 flagellar basal body P-ring protein FlgI [Halomonas sp. FL8]MCP1359393.1 flagellar basal body P-ring protein FlgI [Halomonas sp. BBD45]MCP1366798.1 flagellar basal body P-ring protein FlgI [Halomonas sp. BBD48]